MVGSILEELDHAVADANASGDLVEVRAYPSPPPLSSPSPERLSCCLCGLQDLRPVRSPLGFSLLLHEFLRATGKLVASDLTGAHLHSTVRWVTRGGGVNVLQRAHIRYQRALSDTQASS